MAFYFFQDKAQIFWYDLGHTYFTVPYVTSPLYSPSRSPHLHGPYLSLPRKKTSRSQKPLCTSWSPGLCTCRPFDWTIVFLFLSHCMISSQSPFRSQLHHRFLQESCLPLSLSQVEHISLVSPEQTKQPSFQHLHFGLKFPFYLSKYSSP